MTVYTIQNRKGLNIVLTYSEMPNARGLAFVQHGFSGFKEQPHILAMAGAFHSHGISTVSFDATHAFGASDGDLSSASLTNHLEDLEDVIVWAKTQGWYQEPFYLAGHSLGSASVLSYATKNSAKVKAMAPTSTVVSGGLLMEAYARYHADEWAEIERVGYHIKKSASKPGASGKITKEYFEDIVQYDFLMGAAKLTMPVLLVVGADDDITLPAHQKLLFEKLPGLKEYHEISDCGHTFRSPQELEDLKCIFDVWLKALFSKNILT